MSSRGKARQSTRDKTRRRQESAIYRIRVSALLRPLRLIVPLVAFVASLPGILSYYPRLSVTVRESIRQHEAMGALFELNNGGMLALQEVKISCGLNLVGPEAFFHNVNFSLPESMIGTVAPGDSASAPCEEIMSGFPALSGAISIDVSYRPAYWPWTNGKRFFFQSEKTDHETWIWRPKGSEDWIPPAPVKPAFK
jgi:hypothetical protein